MQLKFTRSKSEKGMLTKSWHFELRALLHVTPSERAALERYSFMKDLVWPMSDIRPDDENIAYLLIRNTKFEHLLTGQIYNNHNLPAVLEVETAIRDACLKAQTYFQVADGFDGRERVLELDDDKAEVVARA